MSHGAPLWGMQVRIDDSNARVIRKNAEAYRRLFKRKKSYSTFVNEALRDMFATKQAEVAR